MLRVIQKHLEMFFFLSFVLNIFLNPLFIFGYGFIPAMGMMGIGVATIISQIVAFFILLAKIMRSSSLKGISIKNFLPNSFYLSKIFFQSAPISAALFMISIGNLIILWYISIFGEFATAGYGSATRFEQILLLPVLGLNTAIISIVAQNFGAKKFLRVEQSYFYAIFYGFTIMVVAGIIIFLSADKIVSIFTNNIVVINYGTTYLKISALIFPAFPIYFISNGFFMAIKKSHYSMFLNIIRNVLLPIPTIYFANFIGGTFKTFFWSYCIFNWIFMISLLLFVTILHKESLYNLEAQSFIQDHKCSEKDLLTNKFTLLLSFMMNYYINMVYNCLSCGSFFFFKLTKVKWSSK